MSVNKSYRDVNMQFDQKQFNKNFEEAIIKEQKVKSEEKDLEYVDETVNIILPHMKPIEDIIITIRELLYRILELLIDKQNPIPYIMSTPDRIFAFTVLILVIGSVLLLLSNLMKSSDEK
jgi:hypothetical protein